MPANFSRTLPGSERAPAHGARPFGPVPAESRVELTVVLRRRAELPPEVAQAAPLSGAELAARYGADPADEARVRDVLTSAGLDVGGVDLASRRVSVIGTAEQVAAVFGVSLSEVVSPNLLGGTVQHRQRVGAIEVPADLADLVVAVLGVDDRPQLRPRLRVAVPSATSVSYTPPELGKVYRFPTGTDGAGQTLAIIELGGGYSAAEVETYFSGLGLPAPTLTAVGVDGAANAPEQDASGADGEVLLDIEVAGALAPKASLAVYFAPNTDRGFLDAVATAVHATPTPTAVSISWGQSEDEWTGQARAALDAAMADAAALGVTVCTAAGDDGSTDRATDGGVHVDFPAASPHALACGGTSLTADPATGTVTVETVWNHGLGAGATGGGVSDVFALPSWQATAGVPPRLGGGTGRGVPDVAADADPATGYQVLVDGSRQVYGGTSAVAPLWAALVCRLAQALGRPLGLLQPALYAGTAPGRPVPGFRDITTGDNGAYAAGPGWDACTGLGVPDGTALLAALSAPPP